MACGWPLVKVQHSLFEAMRREELEAETLSRYIKLISNVKYDKLGVLLPSNGGRSSCTKCKGSGLVDRDGVEADKDIHPILSQKKTICDRCGGSSYEPVPEPRAK